MMKKGDEAFGLIELVIAMAIIGAVTFFALKHQTAPTVDESTQKSTKTPKTQVLDLPGGKSNEKNMGCSINEGSKGCMVEPVK